MMTTSIPEVLEHAWKVVPLSEGQLLDVRPEDALEGGVYRRCSTYRGGGGYDRFPYVCERRLGRRLSEQFVVQLHGCNLDCPYCYVTRAGVWGRPVERTTGQLVSAFVDSGQEVFHLMGGAPALQMRHWPELLDGLGPDAVFHSDMMLTEGSYDPGILRSVSRPSCLYAVSVKGLTPEEWLTSTRRPLRESLFWSNRRALQDAEVPAYATFTGVEEDRLDEFWARAEAEGVDPDLWREDSFVIGLVSYEAVPYVDEVPWGGA